MLRNNANFNLMERVARRVGRSMLRDFEEIRQLQASRKGVADFVRRAHERAETKLMDELAGTRPNYGFRSSAFGERHGTDPTRCWIVNALDGVDNFRHGLAHWSISLALEHKREIVLAVILDAVSNDLFAAEKGDGSWLNDTRMRVSGRSKLADLLVAAEIRVAGGDGPDCAAAVARISGGVGAVRSLGAPALDLAFLAAGRIDALYSPSSSEDGIAAGRMMLAEAGGMSEPADPEAKSSAPGIIAAAGGAFEEFRALVQGPGDSPG